MPKSTTPPTVATIDPTPALDLHIGYLQMLTTLIDELRNSTADYALISLRRYTYVYDELDERKYYLRAELQARDIEGRDIATYGLEYPARTKAQEEFAI